ncbi:MAG: cytochrome c biogenesis protein [Verrucomicrobia bacterium]|nr:cytochrome c biogenesis protein [Verrucomicrobiota bacterium]
MVYSVFLWRGGFRRDNWTNYSLLASGFVFHTLAMLSRGMSFARCPTQNLYEATLFIAWSMVIVYLFVGIWPRLRFLGAFASPVLFAMGIFALMPGLDNQAGPIQPNRALTSLHAALVLLACGTFGLSFVTATMYLTQEHDLKADKLRALLSMLPSMERMESLIGRLIAAGFILLTAGIAVGIANLKFTQDTFIKYDSMVLWALIIWTVYLLVILLRGLHARRGRSFALAAMASFAFLFLTFWGFFLLSSIHHP